MLRIRALIVLAALACVLLGGASPASGASASGQRVDAAGKALTSSAVLGKRW